jgi:hypothetical protein
MCTMHPKPATHTTFVNHAHQMDGFICSYSSYQRAQCAFIMIRLLRPGAPRFARGHGPRNDIPLLCRVTPVFPFLALRASVRTRGNPANNPFPRAHGAPYAVIASAAKQSRRSGTAPKPATTTIPTRLLRLADASLAMTVTCHPISSTCNRHGPCAPSWMVCSMSAVRDGPVMMLTVRGQSLLLDRMRAQTSSMCMTKSSRFKATR